MSTATSRLLFLQLILSNVFVVFSQIPPDYNYTCVSPFQRCSNTKICTLSSKSCNLCSIPGQYVCPISSQCIDNVNDYINCPGIKNTHLDWTLTNAQRLLFLINNLSLYEKYTQLTNDAPEIYRLGIPSFNWLNDDEHGVKNHHATQFADGCGLGAMWSKDDMYKIGNIISNEARRLYNSYVYRGIRGHGQNGQTITLYSPNMNLVRDPRWGRAQEVYSEDPLLSGKLTYHFVTGIQNISVNDNNNNNNNNNSEYLLAAACCKHFAAYDIENIPKSRVKFDAIIDSRNWFETYSPVFYQCIVEAKAAHVMCSYNSINGIPACGNEELLTNVLRDQWNFTGFVVSDYDAMAFIYTEDNYASSFEEAVSISLKAGCDQEGGGTNAINAIPTAINDSLLNITYVNNAFMKLFNVRINLGLFDPPTFVKYNYLINTTDTVESENTLIYARHTASKLCCLYKNGENNDILPLNISNINKIAVIGPQAISTDLLLGNYQLYPDKGVPSFLEAIRNILGENKTSPNCKIHNNTVYNETSYFLNMAYSPDECCLLCYQDDSCNYWSFAEISYNFYCYFYTNISNNSVIQHSNKYTSGECMNKAKLLPNGSNSKIIFEYGCETVSCTNMNQFNKAFSMIETNINTLNNIIVFLGLDQTQEREGTDRKTINLPGYQSTLVQNISTIVKKSNISLPIICILIHGGTLSLKSVLNECDVIVDGWYPGQMGSYGIVDVLFNNGIYGNPAGRASVTYYENDSDLPQNEERGVMNLYYGNGITYRYYHGTNKPIFPFGHGLSYTQFKYSNLTIYGGNVYDACDVINVSVIVSNIGKYNGDEVVQLYIKQLNATVPVPNIRLADFERVTINKNENMLVNLSITPKYYSVVYNASNATWYEPNVWIEKGFIDIYVGGKQPYLYGSDTLNTTVYIENSKPFAQCTVQH